MKILFIGGTGIISTACARLAVERGFEVTLLNRSRRGIAVAGATTVTADIGKPDEAAAALGRRSWDAVVDFLVYNPAELGQRIGLLRGRTAQYLFISSASAYQKPLHGHPLVTESTPLSNPFWDYSRNKQACEETLLRAWRDEGFPGVIVRPSLTYGDTVVPLAVNSWQKSYTAIDRLRRGRPLIVPGDGLTLWTITHNSDFAKGLVGLLGQAGAIGHAFHITSEEAPTWNDLYAATAEAAGVSRPNLVHIASDFIVGCLPDMTGSLLGDKANSALFDNTKIRRFVPDYVATTRYREGIARTIAWFDADPARHQIDEEASAAWDRLIAAYDRGFEAARREFSEEDRGGAR
ncbi:MAG: NAD-dependent epimerase/dehydratase family protein [Opitutaceae bacterium]